MDGKNLFDTIIRETREAGGGELLYAAYRLYILSLFDVGDAAGARQKSDEIASLMPEKKSELARETGSLDFLSRISRAAYRPIAGSSFEKDFREFLPYISRSDSGLQAARDLLRHGLYEEASSLVDTLSQNPARAKAAAEIASEIRADRFIMEGASLPSGSSSNAAVQLLTLAAGGAWVEFEKLSDELPGQDSLPVQKFRKRLYSQYRNLVQGRPIDIQETANVTVGDGATAYQVIPQLERTILFRVLIESVKSDPELQLVPFLDALLRTENEKSGPDRASRMALRSAEVYADYGDPVSAARFMSQYLSWENIAIPSENRRTRAARLGLVLISAKVSDRLLIKQNFWNEILRSGPYSAWQGMLSRAPVNFTESEFQAWNESLVSLEGSLSPSIRHDLYSDLSMLAVFLQRQAYLKGDWKNLLNLAMYSSTLQTVAEADRTGMRMSLPRLQDLTGELLKKLPANQSFTALVDLNEKALRLVLRNNSIQSDELRQSGRSLKGALQKYLDNTAAGIRDVSAAAEITRNYRSMFDLSRQELCYYWFPGIHAFAPVGAEKGDRIFQILDPEEILRRPVLSGGNEISLPLRITALDTGETPPADAEEREWWNRIREMETLSLGEMSANGNALYIRGDLAGRFTSLSGLGRRTGNSYGLWFMGTSGIFEERSERNIGLIMRLLSAELRGPGVLTLKKPDGRAHPLFLRYFYAQSNQDSSLSRRFVAAATALRKAIRDESLDFGYRLVTANFIAD